MAIESPGPGPRRRSRRFGRSHLFDSAVAAFALVASLLYVTASPDLPVWAALLIDVALAAPLLVRRRWPVPVFAFDLLVAAGSGWWATQVVWAPALVIALYTVAVARPRREAFTGAVLLAGGAVVSCVHVFGGEGLAAAVSLVAVVAATTVLGLYIRTRRVLLDELRERAHRVERERDQQVALAAAAERTRIAREMHDIVAHHLTLMVTLADGAAATAVAAPERAAEVMRSVSDTGRLALTDTRRLLGVLRDPDEQPPARAPLPDLAALDQLVDRVRAAGLPVDLDVTGTPPPGPPGAELALYRIVQEALTNTMKHAGPGAGAAVTVRYSAGEVHVEVTDDGVGGKPATGAGRGLVGMRERVDAFGGDVRCGPRSPRGWQVSARLPVAAP